MSAGTSDTMVETRQVDAPADGKESVDDLISQLLTEADEKERELRKSDPTSRYLKVESPAPLANETETLASEAEKEQQRKRPARKPPMKLPADKLPSSNISGKDSVDAAELALEELLRSPKK
jgi:hypothetical protein